ncbi:hypothetical protein [Thiobacillus sp.]|uniref:hypothetical protein n=1 Tax=Thiobacillus sp. TaxID=924 RepID=UPI0025EAEDB7|nr:hypothetical protein [Thiobacillus sp.]MBT9540154.1 hypothetical protein [Thiobacillus sp.]
MRNIKAGRLVRGSSSVKFAILLMLLAGLGIAVDYRMSIPGSSVVDRLYARPVVLDTDALSGDSQLSIKQAYHYLHHTCAAEHGILGDSVCWATISEFNGIDARLIAFFFRNDRLSAVRVAFPAESHPKVLALMQKRFGPERRFGQRTDAFGNKIVGWMRPSGAIAINDSVEGDEEPFVLWTSTDAILMRLLGKP